MAKEIFLTGIVSEWMAEDLRYSLQNSSQKDINIYLSSYGGSVNKGFEMANLIQGLGTKKNINLYNLSHADSIATVIFLAAKLENRHIVESSTMFAHEPRMIVFDEVTQNDADKMSTELEIQKNRIADFYVKNVEGLSKEEAISLMEQETTLTASQMLELNIVNEVLPEFEIAAQRNLISNFNNMSLFNKKQPINTLACKDGVTLLYEGELKEGTEVQKAGELVDLTGEFVDSEERTIKIEANKVTSIEAKESTKPGEVDVAAIIDAVTNAVIDVLDERLTGIEGDVKNIKEKGSSLKIGKVEDKSTESVLDLQAQARVKAQARAKEIQAKKDKNRKRTM